MGSQEDASRGFILSLGEASTEPEGARTPVLKGMSEAEVDAIVSLLRTDKSLATPAPIAAERRGAGTEAAREEAARQAWHIALGERIEGPVDIAALRAHWERGELGPDSLCWCKGFDTWQPVCRVPGLAELLVPRAAVVPSSPEELMPNLRAGVPDFPLKGAAALRILAEEVPPPLPPLAPVAPQQPSPPPVLEPEPVTAPALESEPDTMPEAPRAQQAAGVHVLHFVPAQEQRRLNGSVWLALGGGLVGGLIVACVLWLLGLAWGMRQSSPVSVQSQPAPVLSTVAAIPPPVAPKPEAVAPATSSGAAVAAVAPAPPAPAPAPIARPVITTSVAQESPKHVAPPVRHSPAPQKVARATVPARMEPPKPAAPQAITPEEEEDAELDAAFARELDDPSKRATPPKRTVWIPPDPTPLAVPDSLSESDIFAVVASNKADIASCFSQGKSSARADGPTRVVVGWNILPSGRVTEVLTETRAFQGTPLAICLESKILSWKFPQHREQGKPVRFPFVF
jgi:hypothetical protein